MYVCKPMYSLLKLHYLMLFGISGFTYENDCHWMYHLKISAWSPSYAYILKHLLYTGLRLWHVYVTKEFILFKIPQSYLKKNQRCFQDQICVF